MLVNKRAEKLKFYETVPFYLKNIQMVKCLF